MEPETEINTETLMSVQALFTCNYKTPYQIYDSETKETVNKNYGTVNFGAKYFPQENLSPEAEQQRKTFGQYTPAGHISMDIRNPVAFEGLVPGVDYLVTFTPIPKA